jgi:hypothetical protein
MHETTFFNVDLHRMKVGDKSRVKLLGRKRFKRFQVHILYLFDVAINCSPSNNSIHLFALLRSVLFERSTYYHITTPITPSHLSDSVSTINAQVCTSDIARRIRKKEGHRAHEILGRPHLSLGNKGSPLPLEIRLVIQDLLCPVSEESVNPVKHRRFLFFPVGKIRSTCETHRAVSM